MTKNQKNHERAADKTQTSIAIPTYILEAIQKLADADSRSRNNMIEILLKEAVERETSLSVAETKAKYRTRRVE